MTVIRCAFAPSLRKLLRGGCILIALGSGSLANAEAQTGSPRENIEKQYRKSCVAAELKYVDGVFSIRSSNFHYYGRSKSFTQAGARKFLEGIFAKALRVKEQKVILSFEQRDARHARCQILDTMELTLPATLPKPASTKVFESNSTDEWVKTGSVWELTGSEQTKISSSTRVETGEAAPLPSKSPTP